MRYAITRPEQRLEELEEKKSDIQSIADRWINEQITSFPNNTQPSPLSLGSETKTTNLSRPASSNEHTANNQQQSTEQPDESITRAVQDPSTNRRSEQ